MLHPRDRIIFPKVTDFQGNVVPSVADLFAAAKETDAAAKLVDRVRQEVISEGNKLSVSGCEVGGGDGRRGEGRAMALPSPSFVLLLLPALCRRHRVAQLERARTTTCAPRPLFAAVVPWIQCNHVTNHLGTTQLVRISSH